MDGDMTSKIIKQAAVRPAERFEYITAGDGNGGEGIVHSLRGDVCATAFGLGGLSAIPQEVPAMILPQAKLRYSGEKVVDPGLAGTWNMDRPQMKFVKSPPQPNPDGSYNYAIVVLCNRSALSQQDNEGVSDFKQSLESTALLTGIKLKIGGPPILSNETGLENVFSMLKSKNMRIAVVLMQFEAYGSIKLASDRIGFPSQCIRWKNVDRPPKGFHLNIMIKMNTKLGGTNHTLVSRLPSSNNNKSNSLFQDPPASLSWLFDNPCMLVGIDVSHAEPGSDRESMAAVVASMDGRAGQYVAHLSSQENRVEMVFALQDAMMSLLKSFRERNGGKFPNSIIVFRDGVSDSQFDQVLEKEIPAIRGAIELMGCTSDHVKIAVVICQKRHHTRLVFNENISTPQQPSSLINPCPGLVVDATGLDKSITNANINEFYLNSHAAIQGTSKPCKYALIFDEIGFKLSELELWTYWTTYLYARCNKSVSYATPAYYAHWASKRAKDLFAAGGSSQDLLDISAIWSNNKALSTMFFI